MEPSLRDNCSSGSQVSPPSGLRRQKISYFLIPLRTLFRSSIQTTWTTPEASVAMEGTLDAANGRLLLFLLFTHYMMEKETKGDRVSVASKP